VDRVSRDLKVLAYKDTLTGLYNHRAFQERLREELARARRYRKPLSLVLADIDRFRALNNEIGFQLGDEVLRRIAEVLLGQDAEARLRESDIVARYGGEEFVVLLPETDKAGATTKAERLHSAFGKCEFPAGRKVTMSFGVASFPDDADTTDTLVGCVARALQRAKAKGRDQVRVYGDEDETTGAHLLEVSSSHAMVDTSTVPSFVPEPTEARQFPTYHQHLARISDALDRDHAVNCLYVDLTQLRRIELEYGVNKHAEIYLRAGQVIFDLRGERLRSEDIICRTEDGDAYLCFLSAARTGTSELVAQDLESVALRVQEALENALARSIQDLIHDYPRVTVGYARVLSNSMMRSERLIARLVGEALESSKLMRQRTIQRDKTLLQEIILTDSLLPLYQPIVHLGNSEIFGFEALTRGPRKSPLESPKALFTVADEVNLTFELDRACFRGALRGAAGLEPVHRLFVNLLPLSFYDASFVEKEAATLLDAAALTPANVVFEITERLAIENFASFRQALAGYTAMGFGVAIDDVGTRHSNLETVMSLRPHFLKISDVLTRGIARSTVKREMFRSLGKIAEAIDAVVVAEGIETPDDLAVLRDLGVHYGQGYFLARPGAPFPRLRASVKRALLALAELPREPIGAPPADFDDEGDFREATSPTTGVRQRVALMARGSSEHDSQGDAASERTPAPLAGPGESDGEDEFGAEKTRPRLADNGRDADDADADANHDPASRAADIFGSGSSRTKESDAAPAGPPPIDKTS
jgi:diguanylate cyclase (GGDEF)-like protein